MTRAAAPLLCVVLSACYPSPGPCDQEAALEVVYEASGTPAFAGQAMVVTSCGEGGYCHSEGISDENRFGAPAGLHFDLRLASGSVDIEEAEAIRLGAHRDVMLGTSSVWWEVSIGAMPPPGATGEEYEDQVISSYARVADDGVNFSPLPSIDSDEGREIFRNWLACGAPVVERTSPRADALPNEAGFTVPRCSRGCVDTTWPSIYETVVRRSCALSRCHDNDGSEAGLDLFGGAEGDLTVALDGLLDREAEGELCSGSGIPTITARDPDNSLFYLKVAAPNDEEAPCGGQMPESGPLLAPQEICAIREWIRCGACADPGDARCDVAGCLARARATCDVDTSAPDLCDDALAGRALCSNTRP